MIDKALALDSNEITALMLWLPMRLCRRITRKPSNYGKNDGSQLTPDQPDTAGRVD